MRSIFVCVMLLVSVSVFAQNRSFYVNNVSGTDANPGTIDKPWQSVTPANKFNFEPGDKLLFAGGQTFGKLLLQADDAGLTVSSYNGVATLGGFYAFDVGNITIDNLNFKGAGQTSTNVDGIKFYMDSTAKTDFDNITIQNVAVSNFGGNGISIGAWLTTNGYNNVNILNSSIYDNGVGGISTYGYKDFINNTNIYINNVKAYRNYGRTDITNTNTGSGILIGGFNGGKIEHCEAYENGKYNRATGGGPQGFWCYNSSNIVFQYSTSHNNKAGRIFDGGGFDIDGGSQNCIIQYCYSYDNDGAGYALFDHGSTIQNNNNIIRYNISENDARANAHGAIMQWAYDSNNKVKNPMIYNNTIYLSKSATASAGYPVGVYLKGYNSYNINLFNNIIYTTDSVRIWQGITNTTVFSNDNFFTRDMAQAFKKTGVTNVDPLFKNAGGGKDGYKLRSSSPMINKGKATSITQDIIGTAVPSNGGYDIGAYEADYIAPVSNAGSDKSIALPANSTTLNGSATDADGTVQTYAWTKVSGPTTYTINTPTSASTTVSNLVEGTYVFRLTVTDNDEMKGSDDVQVVVDPATTSAGSKFVKVNLYGGTNPYTNTEWYNWNIFSSRTTPALKYSDATASTISANLSASVTISDNGATYGGTMAPAEVLRYCSVGSAARTLTLSGLSASKIYNLELYASRGITGQSTQFTVGSTSITIVSDNNKTNKASFYNLVPNASGQLVVTITNVKSYSFLNGFILTEQSSTSAVTQVKSVESGSLNGSDVQVTSYPNPSTDYFMLQVKSRNYKSVQLRITDGLGRIIEERQHLATNTNIPVGHQYTPGVYYAEVIQGNRKALVKLVKE